MAEDKSVGEKSITDVYGKQFEKTLVWFILHDKEIGQRVGVRLDPELFDSEEARMIMSFVSEYNQKTNTAASSVMVFAELKQRYQRSVKNSPSYGRIGVTISYLGKIMTMKAPSESERTFVMDKMHEYITRRAIFNAIQKSANQYMDEDYDAIITTITDAVELGGKIISPSTGVDAYSNFARKLRRYHSKIIANKKYPLDIKILDDLMRGGMEPARLGMFMGPSGRGKTLALVHAGCASLRRGYQVVHITLEIDALEVEARYDANFTGVAINKLVDNIQKYHSKLIKVQRAIKSHLYIKEWNSGEVTVADIRAYLDVVRSESGKDIDLLLIDYADLIKPNSNRQNDEATYMGLAQIVRDLRSISSQYDCAVWTASQTGRNSFAAKQIHMQDVAECIEKVRIADVIIGLCQTDDEQRRNRIRLALLKNRLGGKENTLVDCTVDPNTQKIKQSLNQGSNAAAFAAHRARTGGKP